MKAAGALLAAALAVVTAPALAGPSVVDDSGRRVTLAEPARRIVSLAPHVTEALYAAGAGERVVAAVSYSDHPEAARDLPRVGRYDSLNIEAILAQEPDLVVGWGSGNPGAQLARLRDLGLTLYVNEPRRLEEIAASVERLGTLAGTEDAAAEAARAFRERRADLRARYGDRPTLEVFYQIWNDPLMTINDDHVIADVIRGCGGRNVFAGLSALAPRVSVEAVIERDPEVIIASGTGEERPEWLDMWRDWPELDAVRNDNLYFVPPDLLQRHTPRILDGMERMCAQLERVRTGQGDGGA